MMTITPTCLAMVLCDSVEPASESQGPSIMGVFNEFEIDRFPGTTEPFTVWLQVTNGNGPVAMELIVERIPAEVPEPDLVTVVGFSMTFEGPNDVLEYRSNFADGINLEEAGLYRLRLTADGSTILQRYFVAQTGAEELR
jgi:hypothetical protein